MSDTTNDIDALLHILQDYPCYARHHAALTALVAERDALKQQRDEARELNKEWQQKAATWLATPEAIARLQSYRDLGGRVAEAHSKIDLLRADLAAAIKQRDEARRRVCELSMIKKTVYRKLHGVDGRFIECKTPEEIAQVYDWDCFAEKEGGGA